MDFEYEYTVSGSVYIDDADLDLIIENMIDDVSGKPDIENFDEAYWDYIDWRGGTNGEEASEIQDAVKEEIMRRIKEEDYGEED